MRTLFVTGVLGLSVLMGCVGVVDSTGGDDTTNPNPDPNPNPNPDPNPTPTPMLAATIDKPTVTTALGESATLIVNLTGSGGFSGPVTLTPSVMDAGGAPVSGWTMTMTPPTVNLAADGTASVTISVDIPTDTASLATTVKVGVSAASVTAQTLTSAFTVANTYTIQIKAGTGTGTHAGVFPTLLKLKTGAQLIFHNADTIAHRIHGNEGNGNTGIAHEANDLQPGANYKVTPSGSDTFYCHDHDIGPHGNLSLL